MKQKDKPKYSGRITRDGNFYGGYSGKGGYSKEARNDNGDLTHPKEARKGSLLWVIIIPIISFVTLVLVLISLFIINRGSDPLWAQVLGILAPFFFYLLLLPLTIRDIRTYRESKLQLTSSEEKKSKHL